MQREQEECGAGHHQDFSAPNSWGRQHILPCMWRMLGDVEASGALSMWMLRSHAGSPEFLLVQGLVVTEACSWQGWLPASPAGESELLRLCCHTMNPVCPLLLAAASCRAGSVLSGPCLVFRMQAQKGFLAPYPLHPGPWE